MIVSAGNRITRQRGEVRWEYEKIIHSKIYIQEWLEELPHILVKEYGDMDFDVVFYGTWQDFEDLKEVFAQECEREKITARLRRIPAKEVTDIEKLLDGILRKMQNAPFDGLLGYIWHIKTKYHI